MSPASVSGKSVAICDTEPIAIEGVRALLNTCDDLCLAAAEDSLLGSLEMVRRHDPSVLILDKAFGTHAILDCLKRLRDYGYTAAPIVWGASLTEVEALRMLQAGALGVIQKGAPTPALLDCIRTVASGDTWMEESAFPDAEPFGRGARSNLTARELQVVELVERGLKNRDIAASLGIRPGTVKIHLKHIFEKTGIHGRYGLALSALRQKGLPMPAWKALRAAS